MQRSTDSQVQQSLRSTESNFMNINHLEEAIKVKKYATELRRHFHQFPESSTKEIKTTRKIREELKLLDIPYEEATEIGTIGLIEGSCPGPVVALRADIDALEITEKTGLSYSSKIPGLMHACGHDLHTAALLGAAKVLKAHQSKLKGTVKLIFQPAEEIGKGAKIIIKHGNLSDVSAFFGIHNTPELDKGYVSLGSGCVSAGANSLHITLEGKSGHAAHPDQTIDTITAGASIIEGLQHFVSRELDPTTPAVISVCTFHAGTRDNIIASHADIGGTVRVTCDEARAQVREAVHRIAEHTAAAHRVSATVDCEYATPTVYNDEKLYPIALKAAEKIEGVSIVSEPLSMATEDFGDYRDIAPAFFARVGVGIGSPLHSDTYDPDEEALPYLTALFTSFTETYQELSQE